MDKKILGQWLTAGYIEKNQWHPTTKGTPQGGLCEASHKPPYGKEVVMRRKQ
jgi:hypothetical protein